MVSSFSTAFNNEPIVLLIVLCYTWRQILCSYHAYPTSDCNFRLHHDRFVEREPSWLLFFCNSPPALAGLGVTNPPSFPVPLSRSVAEVCTVLRKADHLFERSSVSVLVHGAIETSAPPCLARMGSTPRFHAEAGLRLNHYIVMQ